MRNIKLILACLFVLFQGQLLAHNANLASIKLIIQEKGTFLDLNMSQYGIEQDLLKNNPNLDLKTISQTELKELIINEIKEHIQLSINGEIISLGTGVIKLGSHVTNLKFVINNLPEIIELIDVKANCFQENKNQINFFTVLYQDKNARAKLFDKNNYQSKFIVTKDEINVSDNLRKSKWSLTKKLVITILIIICFLTIYFIIKKRKTIDNNV